MLTPPTGAVRFQRASDQSLLIYFGDQITLETNERIRRLLSRLRPWLRVSRRIARGIGYSASAHTAPPSPARKRRHRRKSNWRLSLRDARRLEIARPHSAFYFSTRPRTLKPVIHWRS